MSEDFRIIAERRLREARLLLQAGEWSGAYYLAGYAIECGLKASILRSMKRYHMPDKKLIHEAHVHDLGVLVDLAGLRSPLNVQISRVPAFGRNWAVVKDWNEQSRYLSWTHADATDLLSAVGTRGSGVMPWVKKSW